MPTWGWFWGVNVGICGIHGVFGFSKTMLLREKKNKTHNGGPDIQNAWCGELFKTALHGWGGTELEDLNFSYFTAGLGGSGPVNLLPLG